MDRAKRTAADSSPVVGVLLLGATTLALGTAVGFMAFAPEATAGYSGVSVSADVDRQHSTIGATVIDIRDAEYVNISVYGYGNGVKARLTESGSSLAVGEREATIAGSGRIYDMEGDAVVSRSGSSATLGPGQGVSSDDPVTIRAVAVDGGQERVVLETSGSL